MGVMRRVVMWCAAVVWVLLLVGAVGCESSQKTVEGGVVEGGVILRDGPGDEGHKAEGEVAVEDKIDGAAVVAAYNDRAGRVKQVWARAVLEAEWREGGSREGRRRWEQGDGVFILRKPRDVSLSIGKLGEVMFQIGGNDAAYWFFELKPAEGEPTSLTVGRYGEGDEVAAGGEIGIGMRADELVGLLGVTALPAGVSVEAAGDGAGGEYRVVWSDEVRGVEVVWVLDREYRPVSIRVESLGGDGERHVLEAGLGRYERLELAGVGRGGWPWLATRVEVRVPDRGAVMTLFLENPSDGVERDRVKDVQFDLEVLRDVYEPQRVMEVGGGG